MIRSDVSNGVRQCKVVLVLQRRYKYMYTFVKQSSFGRDFFSAMAESSKKLKSVTVFSLFIVCSNRSVGQSVVRRYSQGPKVFPQRRNFHRLQCIFKFARKFTMLLLANTFLCFWCHLKVKRIRKYSVYFHSILLHDTGILKLQRFKNCKIFLTIFGQRHL